MRIRNAFVGGLVLILTSGASAQTPATITVTSPTIKANETIPVDHTADGKNLSPALSWTGAPANTRQFALVYDDPDVVFGAPDLRALGGLQDSGHGQGAPGGSADRSGHADGAPRHRRRDSGIVGLQASLLSRSGTAARKAASLYVDGLCARRRTAARAGPDAQPVDGSDQGPHHRPGIAGGDLRKKAEE